MIWRNEKINSRTRWSYPTRCLWNYDYIKNHYRLLAIDLSCTILGDNDNATDAEDNDQSLFVLTILEKNKITRLKFSQRSETVLNWKILGY